MARVFVLDQDGNVVERLRQQLSSLGHEVVSSGADAYAALADVQRANADLMAIALNLPGGGAQLVDRLRGEPATARTPIIVLFDDNWTGVGQDSLTRLLQKPTDLDALKCVLDELLPQKSSPRNQAASGLEAEEFELPPSRPSLEPGRPMPMDMGAPSDDELPPGEILEL